MSTQLEDLKKKIEALSPPRRLLLASQLMEQGHRDIAITIAEGVVVEYQASKLFGRTK